MLSTRRLGALPALVVAACLFGSVGATPAEAATHRTAHAQQVAAQKAHAAAVAKRAMMAHKQAVQKRQAAARRAAALARVAAARAAAVRAAAEAAAAAANAAVTPEALPPPVDPAPAALAPELPAVIDVTTVPDALAIPTPTSDPVSLPEQTVLVVPSDAVPAAVEAVAPVVAPVVEAAPAVAPASSVAAQTGMFGAQFHAMWSSYTDAKREMVLDTMQANGVKSVRIDVSWAMLQPTGPNSYDPWGVGFIDSSLRRVKAHGISPIVTLWLTPAWANGGKGEHTLPTNPADYARAAGWAAAHWDGVVDGWEVWNEPNSEAFMTGHSAVAYAALLKAAYPAFKAGSPSTPVVFGGPEYVDVEWVRTALAAGATNSFDVMGVHPYMGVADASPLTPDDGTVWTLNHVAVLHDLLVAKGRADAPVWFTEFGWSVAPTTASTPNWMRGVTAQQQAEYLVQTVRHVRATMPYVGRVFWYQDLVGIQDGFYSGYGLVNQDGSPTLALQAAKGL